MKPVTEGDDDLAHDLYDTTDAGVWAHAFLHTVVHGGVNIDLDLMVTWFANAIETGRDAYRWTTLPDEPEFDVDGDGQGRPMPMPLLRRSGLTKTVWVVTRYKERPNRLIEAFEKFDVTDQFDALVAEDSSEVTP